MLGNGFIGDVAKRFGFGETTRKAPLRTEDEIRQWMAERLAERLKIPVTQVDVEQRFDAYGLDSRTAVQVSGELEKAVERRLSPALLIEHPTINGVARELARELSSESNDD